MQRGGRIYLCVCVAVVLAVLFIFTVLSSKSGVMRGIATRPLTRFTNYTNVAFGVTATTEGLVSSHQVPASLPLSPRKLDGGSEACLEIGSFRQHEELTDWKTFVKTLADYKLFHKEQIELLGMGNQTVRTLTFFCPTSACGGIGDVLYESEYYFLLAIISRRVISIVWNDHHSKTMKYLHPNEINWEYFNPEVGMHTEKTSKLTTKGWYMGGENDMANLSELLYSPTVHVTFSSEVPLPFENGFRSMMLDPTLAAKFNQIGLGGLSDKVPGIELLPLMCGKILRYLFTFSPQVISAVDSIQESLGIRGQRYVGAHLRTGFIGSNQEESVAKIHEDKKIFRKPADWLETFKCSVKLADENVGLSAFVYLASDSDEVKRLATEQFPTRIITANLTLQHSAFNEDNAPVHHYAIDGFMSTWVDFLLLARSHVLVRAKSGFPSVAGQFCSNVRQYCVPLCREPVKETGTCWHHSV